MSAEMTDAEAEALHARMLVSEQPASIGLLIQHLDVFLAYAKRTNGRLAELERAPLVYEGPHEAGKVYDKGQFTTHNGSLWHCNYKTASRPGDGSAWTLSVKAGRDGKGARNER